LGKPARSIGSFRKELTGLIAVEDPIRTNYPLAGDGGCEDFDGLTACWSNYMS